MAPDNVAWILGIAIFAGSAIGYLLWRRHTNAELNALRISGVVAEATVTEVIRDPGGEGPGEIGISYSFMPLSANRPVSRTEMLGMLPEIVPKVGDRVRVRYDPNRPDIARLDLHGDSSAF